MATMKGYSAPPYMNMPPREYGQAPGYYPPNPSVPPANLVRQPRYPPSGPNPYPQQEQGPSGRPYPPRGGGDFQAGGYMPQGQGQRGPRGPYPGAGAQRAPYAGRREGGPQGGPQGAQGQQRWNAPQGQQQPQQQGQGGAAMQQMPTPAVRTAPQQPQPPVVAPQQQPARAGTLNPTEIARMAPEQAKRMIGENMYPKIGHLLDEPNKGRAGKITGMLLEALDSAELLNLLEDTKALEEKLAEALRVLNEAEQT